MLLHAGFFPKETCNCNHAVLLYVSAWNWSRMRTCTGMLIKYRNGIIMKRFFSNRVVNDWNGLDSTVAMAPSLDTFRKRLELSQK